MPLEISLDLTGLRRAVEIVAAGTVEVVEAGATATAEGAAGRIRAQVGTGHHYPWLPNRSSAPGESPVSQSGDLASSVTVAPDAGAAGQVAADAIVTEEYGQKLELGSGRILPRPFLEPAALEEGAAAARAAVAAVAGRLGALP